MASSSRTAVCRHARQSLGALASAAACFLASCGDEQSCTDEARNSVAVTVVGANDETVDDAEVSYAVDGGPRRPCEPFGDVYICGLEEHGSFSIQAVRGAESGSATVVVGRDACHVISESVQISLGG